jgi:ABC-type nitrate/sulfonate/bicarbonate transport system substrate-binding protein
MKYLGGILSFLICLALSTAVLAADQVDIRYGGQYYPDEFLLKGHPQFWSKYDLKVEHILFSSGVENNQALMAGKCDINCGADIRSVALFNAMGDKVIIIGTIERGNRYSTVVGDKAKYKSWKDLKGKTVATRFGTGAELVLRKFFSQQKDLKWEDFKWVNMKIEDMPAALKSGSIQAFTAWEPTPAIAEAQGDGTVMRQYGDVALMPVFLHTTTDFIKTHRPQIVKFLAAQLDKAQMIKENPEEAARLAAKAANAQGYNVSGDVFLRVFKRIDFSLGIDPGVVKSFNEAAQFLYNEKKINKIPKIKYDASLLKDAKKLREKTK